jgi:hypothetical protein
VATEELFGRSRIGHLPELTAWWEYVSQRYPWLSETSQG